MRDVQHNRLHFYIFIRTFIITILLGTFYIFKIEYNKLFYPVAFGYFVAFLYLLTILYALFLRWINTRKQLKTFTYILIIIDIIASTCLIFLTGGIASWFSFLLLLNIISGSIMLNRRACFIFAILSSIFYGLLLNLQLANIIPPTTNHIYYEKEFFYNIFANTTAFIVVSILSGYLSKELHETTEDLKEKNVILSDLRALSRDIIESIPSGILTTNFDNRIITFNTAALKIMRYDISEVIDKTPEEIFPFLSDFLPLERVEGEVNRNGKNIIIGIKFSDLKNNAGEPTGMIGVFQDLTKLKAMEEEVKQREKWASIGELSALIAHELRNPLAALKASIEMLHEKSSSGEHADRLMKIAVAEMDRLNVIVTDFLLYAKPVQQNKKPFDLHQSLKDITLLLQSSSEDNNNIEIKSNLPGKILVKGDARQLQQVFWNLGVNAVHAISDSGAVSIYTEKNETTVKVIFKDTGAGLVKEDMKKIFFPFYTTKEHGTGLGLSIAQRITEEHGGEISVESNGTGSGTLFSVELPLYIK
jgi:two-component system sensor histidine kinase PilS (NtrC family)